MTRCHVWRPAFPSFRTLWGKHKVQKWWVGSSLLSCIILRDEYLLFLVENRYVVWPANRVPTAWPTVRGCLMWRPLAGTPNVGAHLCPNPSWRVAGEARPAMMQWGSVGFSRSGWIQLGCHGGYGTPWWLQVPCKSPSGCMVPSGKEFKYKQMKSAFQK